MTVRDFTQVFDSYAQFEESMIAAKMETTSEMGREEEGESCIAGGEYALALVAEQGKSWPKYNRGEYAPLGLFVRHSWAGLGVFLNVD